jgi:hypothetical protein
MAIKDSTLTQEYLHSLFYYKDGNLYWKKKSTKLSRANIGSIAGSLSSSGYLQTGVKGKIFLNHRLIFLMHYGYLPQFIDHKDGNKTNNKIENLRETNKSQNRMNAKLQKNNISGIKNVNWSKKERKWVVQIGVNSKKLRFGSYFDLNVAKFVAETMRHKYCGLFAKHK